VVSSHWRFGRELPAGGLAQDPRDQRPERPSRVLPQLDGEHFGGVHLAVQELDDPAQLRGDDVGDEEEADPAGLEVGLHPRPEVVGRDSAPCERGDPLVRVEGFSFTALLVPAADHLHGPVEDRVGGVVEHLADDLAADARIAAALDLD